MKKVLMVLMMVVLIGNLVYAEWFEIKNGDTASKIASEYVQNGGMKYMPNQNTLKERGLNEEEIVIEYLRLNNWSFDDIHNIKAGYAYELPGETEYSTASFLKGKAESLFFELISSDGFFTNELSFNDYVFSCQVEELIISVHPFNAYPIPYEETLPAYVSGYDLTKILRSLEFIKNINPVDLIRRSITWTYYSDYLIDFELVRFIDKSENLTGDELYKKVIGLRERSLEFGDTGYLELEWISLEDCKDFIEFKKGIEEKNNLLFNNLNNLFENGDFSGDEFWKIYHESASSLGMTPWGLPSIYMENVNEYKMDFYIDKNYELLEIMEERGAIKEKEDVASKIKTLISEYYSNN